MMIAAVIAIGVVGVVLLIALAIISFLSLRTNQAMQRELRSIPEIKYSIEAVVRASGEAMKNSEDVIRRSVTDLDRSLQNMLHEMTTKYEAALRNLAQTTERFQSSTTSHLQETNDLANRQENRFTEMATEVANQNGAALAKTAEQIRKAAQDFSNFLNDRSLQVQAEIVNANAKLLDAVNHFDQTVKDYANDQRLASKQSASLVDRQEATTDAQRNKLEEKLDGVLTKLEALLKTQTEQTHRDTTEVRNDLSGVVRALDQLRASLDEAVRF